MMRLALFATLALSSTAALAQTGNSNGLIALADAPAPLVHTANPASTPAASVAIAPAAHLHDLIATSVSLDLRDTAEYRSGLVAHTFYLGSNENEIVSAPRLIHTVNRVLREEDAVPGKADVSVAMRVSTEGVPTDLKIVHSAGAAIDKDTLAAVSQYRFQPGMLNRLPAESSVTVHIQLAR
jgi:hypothetical protein